MILEVCVESVEGALIAAEAGADRVELCADLYRGGTTPGPSALRLACERAACDVVALVRARPAGFEYSELELEEMCADIHYARQVGSAGVALGALTAEGDIDPLALARFMRAAGGLPVTFHRAFDWSRDRERCLEVLIDAGVRRVLSSGGARNAQAGRDELRRLVELADDRIAIIAAGGVRAHNVRELVRASGVSEVHFAAFEPAPQSSYSRAADCPLSATSLPGDDERRRASAQQVRAVRAALEARP